MKSEQESTTLRHERIAGAEFGKTLGGAYYQNLRYYQNPIRRFVQQNRRKRYKIVDIGGGSGIVGCALLRTVMDLGIEGKLDVYDINPRQLEGVAAESEKLKIPNKLIRFLKHDVLMGISEKYDIASMRKVLHCFNAKENEEVISKLPNYLVENGILVLGALCEQTPFQAEYKSKILNEIEKSISKGKKFHKKYVVHDKELEKMLKNNGLRILSSENYYEEITLGMSKEKWKLSNANINQIELIGTENNFLTKPNSSITDIEFLSRLRQVQDLNTGEIKITFGNPYIWRNKVFVCEKDEK
ncbi:class I SAM-dependent methyltransferase [Candidatus Pacearchaeota archaeon]|nr:class I SAM-dependent methyltransferase [Candidatus Pacearchaeota archaeon]